MVCCFFFVIFLVFSVLLLRSHYHLENCLINFILLAFVVFCLVKAVNAARRSVEREKAVEPEAPAADPADIALLREIRDLLKRQ